MKLPNLRTLNVHNWPSCAIPFEGNMWNTVLHLYESQLQSIARNLLIGSDEEAVRQRWGYGNRSKLAVIAFGTSIESRLEADRPAPKLKQIIFTRGEIIDGSGRKQLTALKTLWRHVRFIEPECAILSQSSDIIIGT